MKRYVHYIILAFMFLGYHNLSAQCPTITLTFDEVDGACNDSNGRATVFVSGGVAPYTYLWEADAHFQTTPTATGLHFGWYDVTVTDFNGCTAVDSAGINNDAFLFVQIDSFRNNVGCGANGMASVSPIGGDPPYSWNWGANAGGQTSQVALALTGGIYRPTVTDALGCSGEIHFNFGGSIVIQDISSTLSTSVDMVVDNTSCSPHNGQLTVSAAGDSPPFSFQWGADAANQTGPVATGLGGGIYQYTVTDVTGCTKTENATVDDLSGSIFVNVGSTSPNTSCNVPNGSATAGSFGGQPPFTYQWDAGTGNQTTAMATALVGGFYEVTASDALGCTGTASAFIGEVLSTITVGLTASNANTSCSSHNGSLMVSGNGGQAPYSYQWDANAGNQTNATATGLPGGSFTVTVSDVNGCSEDSTFMVVDSGGSTITLTVFNITHNTSCTTPNGMATVGGSGGVGPLSYQWDANAGSQTTATASFLAGGTYSITVTDGVCSSSTSVVVNDLVTSGCTNPAACNYDPAASCDDGSCNLPDGCTNPAACNYDPSAVCDDGSCTSPDGCTNPAACNYNPSAICDDGSCILPDGCTNPAACNYDPSAVCDDGSCNLPDGCTNSTACNYDPSAVCDDGSCILPDGCTNPAACNYDPSAVCDDGSCNLPDGCTNPLACNYNPSAVCDDGSCAFISLTLSQSSDNTSCTAPNGSITVSGSGGTPAYTYLWDSNASGQTTAMATGLQGGTYSVTVTDNSGCSEDSSFAISNSGAAVSVTVSTTNVSSCITQDGSATAVPSGGTTPYTYVWNAVPVQTGSTITGLSEGTYDVTVTDGVGCTATGNGVVGSDIISMDFSNSQVTQILCNGDDDGAIDVSVTGAIGSLSYTWSNGATTEDISGLAPGNYIVSVVDGAGCAGSFSFWIDPPPFNELVLNVINESASGANDGSIAAITNFTPASYLWSNGATTSSIGNLSPGEYSVTVTDSVGCVIVDTATVDTEVGIRPVGVIENLLIHPNPTEGQVNVSVDLDQSNRIIVEWFSIEGKILIQEELGMVNVLDHQYDLSDHPEGIYFVRVSIGRMVSVKKVLVAR